MIEINFEIISELKYYYMIKKFSRSMNPFKEQTYTPEDINIINRELTTEEVIGKIRNEIEKISKTKREINTTENLILTDDMKRRMKVIERINKKKGLNVIRD